MARKRRTKKSSKPKIKSGKIKHIKTVIDGITFDSKMESQYYEHLKELKAKGIVIDFKLQPEFILQEKFMVIDGRTVFGDDPDFNKLKRQTKAPTVQAIKYISDFDVTYADGHNEIVDPKGVATADFELKRKMFMCKFPEKTLKVVVLYKGEWVDYYSNKKRIAADKKAAKLLQGGN